MYSPVNPVHPVKNCLLLSVFAASCETLPFYPRFDDRISDDYDLNMSKTTSLKPVEISSFAIAALDEALATMTSKSGIPEEAFWTKIESKFQSTKSQSKSSKISR